MAFTHINFKISYISILRKCLFLLLFCKDALISQILSWRVRTSGAARISSRGRPKFFEQHSPGAVVKPSESSRNRDIETSSPQEMRGVCGF